MQYTWIELERKYTSSVPRKGNKKKQRANFKIEQTKQHNVTTNKAHIHTAFN